MGYDFTLSEDQQLLQKTANKVVRDRFEYQTARDAFDNGPEQALPLWRELAGLGWASLCVPTEQGGAGLGAIELALVARELGRRAAPVPFVVHNAAAAAVATGATPYGNGSTRDFASLDAGAAILTVAHHEDSAFQGLTNLSAAMAGSRQGQRLFAVKPFVPYGSIATDFLITAIGEDGQGVLVIVPRRRLTSLRPYRSTAGDGRAVVQFEGEVDPDCLVASADTNALARVVDLVRLGTCAFVNGAASQAMEMAVDYVKERIAFGRPLGSFQAVQHRCTEMLFDCEAGWLLTLEAAWRYDNGQTGNGTVEAACAYVAQGQRRTLGHAHQVHGAMGFTYEYDLSVLSIASKGAVQDLGRLSDNREAVATAAGL